MVSNHFIALDGIEYSSEEELKKANEQFWNSIFVSSANISSSAKEYYISIFKIYYERLKENQNPEFSEWDNINRPFQYLANLKVLKFDFVCFFEKVLVLFPPLREILNEEIQYIEQYNELVNNLNQHLKYLQEVDGQGRK